MTIVQFQTSKNLKYIVLLKGQVSHTCKATIAGNHKRSWRLQNDVFLRLIRLWNRTPVGSDAIFNCFLFVRCIESLDFEIELNKGSIYIKIKGFLLVLYS